MLQRDDRPLRGMAKPPSQTLPPHEGEGLGLGVRIAYGSDWYNMSAGSFPLYQRGRNRFLNSWKACSFIFRDLTPCPLSFEGEGDMGVRLRQSALRGDMLEFGITPLPSHGKGWHWQTRRSPRIRPAKFSLIGVSTSHSIRLLSFPAKACYPLPGACPYILTGVYG